MTEKTLKDEQNNAIKFKTTNGTIDLSVTIPDQKKDYSNITIVLHVFTILSFR